MALTRVENDPLARCGDAIYDERIRRSVEPGRNGQYVVIDVDSGDYEVDPDQLAATHRLKARRPDARLWVRRAGYRFVTSFASITHAEETG